MRRRQGQEHAWAESGRERTQLGGVGESDSASVACRREKKEEGEGLTRGTGSSEKERRETRVRWGADACPSRKRKAPERERREKGSFQKG